MPDDTDQSSREAEEARRREAARLTALIADYRSRREALNAQCEAMEAAIADLEGDLGETEGSSLNLELRAERDRLQGELSEAELTREQKRAAVTEERSRLAAEIAAASAELAELRQRVALPSTPAAL